MQPAGCSLQVLPLPPDHCASRTNFTRSSMLCKQWQLAGQAGTGHQVSLLNICTGRLAAVGCSLQAQPLSQDQGDTAPFTGPSVLCQQWQLAGHACGQDRTTCLCGRLTLACAQVRPLGASAAQPTRPPSKQYSRWCKPSSRRPSAQAESLSLTWREGLSLPIIVHKDCVRVAGRCANEVQLRPQFLQLLQPGHSA